MDGYTFGINGSHALGNHQQFSVRGLDEQGHWHPAAVAHFIHRTYGATPMTKLITRDRIGQNVGSIIHASANQFDIAWGPSDPPCSVQVYVGRPGKVCSGQKLVWTCGDDDVAYMQFEERNDQVALRINDFGVARQFKPYVYLAISASIVALHPNLGTCTRLNDEQLATLRDQAYALSNSKLIKNKKNSDFCTRSPSFDNTPAFRIEISECDGSLNQEWKFVDGQIKNANGHCLDVYVSWIWSKSRVGTHECQPGRNQLWDFNEDDLTISPRHAPYMCLDVKSGSMENGASLITSYCINGLVNQKWALVDYSHFTPGKPANYTPGNPAYSLEIISKS